MHGGILHLRGNKEHVSTVAEHGIQPIDMVVVNLYAFEKTAAKPGAHFEEIIENIDIGGPSMVRSAAKNFQDVAIVTSPDRLRRASPTRWTRTAVRFRCKPSGAWRNAPSPRPPPTIPRSPRRSSASPSMTPASSISRKLTGRRGFPQTLRLSFNKAFDLRYGENPHQKAALYSDGTGLGVANGSQLQGKELSYNNIVDLQAAWDLAQEFEEPVVAIIKHTNPCGTAISSTLVEAYKRALEADPVSAFGGVIGVNREIDEATAEEMAKLFLEVIAAPSFSEGAKARVSPRRRTCGWSK